MSTDHLPDGGSPPAIRNWVFVGFLFVAGFFLFTEHRAHALGALPYLLLLACPLMHFFGHGQAKPDTQDGNKSAAPPDHHKH